MNHSTFAPILLLRILLAATVLLRQSMLGATNEIQFLSGIDKDHTVPWEFRVSAGRNSGFWTNIPVPSCWDTKGFGSYEFGNDTTSEFGEYRHAFTVPRHWAGKRVFLVFEGSMTDTETRINGAAPGALLPSSRTPDERAFDNRATVSSGQIGGAAITTTGIGANLGRLTSFTFTCWIKPDGGFSAIPNARFPRLISVAGAPDYDGGTTNGAQLLLYNSSPTARALQLKLHSESGSGALSSPNILNGDDWTFVAVTYDSTARSAQVNFFVGNRAAPIRESVSTATYNRGAIDFGSDAFVCLLNRADRSRAFDGCADDFRIFDAALTPAQIEAVRASGLGIAAAPPVPRYRWNFDYDAGEGIVKPVVGSNGVLHLHDARGTTANLLSANREGVSGGVTGTGAALHQGGFYEFSYEITSNLLFDATNLLEVTVHKKSANNSINQAERQADYWTFGGIYRPVYLEARPSTFIERIATDPRADGEITVHAFVSGITDDCTLAARVADSTGAPLGDEFTGTIVRGQTNLILSARLPTPKPWSPEFPNLYQLTIELRRGSSLLHSLSQTIGFRTISFTNSVGFYLNGRKIMMRGVNRHEFWPTDGRATSRALSIADINLMKDMNLNAVRMSHYPPAKHFLEECDRLGLLVINELGGWQSPAYDDSIAPRLVRELVTRDVNHPCIFAWANGNEGGFNRKVDSHYPMWDPQHRTVLHPANWESEITGGVRTHHYAFYSVVTNYLGAGKPVFMPTEIQHALYDGGGGAGLEDHWNAMRAAPNSAGMFIWALLDECVVRDDRNGKFDGSGDSAPDGIVGPFREKEASYFTVKSVWSPIQIQTPDPESFSGTLTVENRFDFTHLDQCAFRWQLGNFPDPDSAGQIRSNDFNVVVQGENFAGPRIAPGASGSLQLSLPSEWNRVDALRLTASDPHGREVYTWTWPLRTAAEIHGRVTGAGNPKAEIAAKTAGAQLRVSVGSKELFFDLKNGRLVTVAVSGRTNSFGNGPRAVSGSWNITNVTHGFDGSEYVITADDLTNSPDAFQWRIRPDGWTSLRYRYTLVGTQSWMGITFNLVPESVTAMRWLGQGPYRVWRNRLAGQEMGVHWKTANETDTGKEWSYPEFRGYHGRVHWASLETAQGRITLSTPTPDLYLRALTPPTASESRPGVSPPFPEGELSLLHGINAIGNKFALPDTATIGPTSAPNIASGLYSGEVDFHFGDL